MSGVHMGGDNLSFIDGHDKTYKVKPIQGHWVATGGGDTLPAYTYHTGLNIAGSLPEAKWRGPQT